jgi:hypothetical protein
VNRDAVRLAISRIELYSSRALDKVESGQRHKLFNALADIVEVGEIVRRLIILLESEIRGSEDSVTPSEMPALGSYGRFDPEPVRCSGNDL